MRGITALLSAFLLLCAGPALAQQQQSILPLFAVLKPGAPITPPSYTGPGDVVSGATGWWGLRAYNASYATGSNNAINVRRASDNTTSNIVILANGNLDVATANTFATQDATASCTIATTTATCTGASSTPHVGSTITGAGLTQPCYIFSVGSFVAGSGTLTLTGNAGLTSPCGTVSVAETLTMQYALFITELYDQTGNTRHLIQSTTADQPQLLPNCLNSLPCWAQRNPQIIETTSPLALAQPYTQVVVSNHGKPGGSSNIFGDTAVAYGGSSTTNTDFIFGGSSITFTATGSAWHVIQGVYSGGSSVANADNTQTTGNAGATALSGDYGFPAFSVPELLTEGGLWAGALTTPQQTSMCHNAYTYWATSVSC